MPAKSTFPYIFLFIAAFTAGIIPFSAPMEHHWTLQDMLLSINTPLIDLFKPFLGTSTRMFLFRPVSLLLLKILYFFFSFNIAPYRIYKALFLSFFSLSVYAYLNLFAPRNERQNFWVALLSALSPPVFVSTYMITAEDIPGSMLLFASLALFLRLIRESTKKKQSTLFAFYACVLLTCLIRETSRTHLFLLLALHFLHERKSLSPTATRHTLYAMGFCAITTLFSMVLMSRVASTPWLKLPLTAAHFSFLLQNAFSQIVACISFSAMALIVYNSLLRRAYAKEPKPFRLFLLVIFAFLFLTIKKQPLLSFSYFGLYVFSPAYILPLVSILFFLALLSKVKSQQDKNAFCSQAILLIVLTTLGATLLFKSVREDLPSRTFISILPFLFYFVIQSAASLHALCVEQKQKGNKIYFLRLSRAYLFINLALFFVFSPVNYAFEFQNLALVSDESKRFLAKQPLKNALVFYSNNMYPTYPEDFGILNSLEQNKNLEPHLFFVLEPFKKGYTDEEKYKKIKDEICLKAGGLYVHVDFKGKRGKEKLVASFPATFKGFKEKAYIHLFGEKTFLHSFLFVASLEDSFTKYAKDSFSEFVPSKKFSARGYWENPMPVNIQKFRYSFSSDLENFLHTIGRMPLYETSLPYIQFPRSLEEALFWVKTTHAFMLKNAVQSKIYFLDISRLNCYEDLRLKPNTRTIPIDFNKLPRTKQGRIKPP